MACLSIEDNKSQTLEQALFEAIPFPTFVVDDDVRILRLNSAAMELCADSGLSPFGTRAGEILHCIHSAETAEGCGGSPECCNCAMRSSANSSMEGRLVRRAKMRMSFAPKASRRPMEFMVSAFPVVHNGKKASVLLVEDITLTGELERALRRSETLAVTGQLTATIAHEINNPLDSLGNILHILNAEPEIQAKSKELIELAQKEVQRLTEITHQTLSQHRESQGPAAAGAAEVLEGVLSLFRRKLQMAKIQVHRDYQLVGSVSVSPGELRQVFTNLVTNAIDAIGRSGKLNLSIESETEGLVTVRIEDSGCGIPAENLSTIFEPFFTTKGEKGTGIGLWVTKEIIEGAGGKIEVRSSTTGDRGTCFTLSLPTAESAFE